MNGGVSFRGIRSRNAVAQPGQAEDPGKSTTYPVHVRNASIDSRKSRAATAATPLDLFEIPPLLQEEEKEEGRPVRLK